MDFIFIEELRVDAQVGVYPREQVKRQPLELELTFGVPDAAAERDSLEDTVDYAKVVERIRVELSQRQFNLVETLGEYVVSLLFDEFKVPWVKLRVAKIGVMQGVRRVGVYIQRGRDEHSRLDAE